MATPPKETDSKWWLIWLGIGVVLALFGPTWLYNRHFNPTEDVIFHASKPEESATPLPSPDPESDTQR